MLESKCFHTKEILYNPLGNHAKPHWRADVDLLDQESTTVKKFTGNSSCSIRVIVKIIQRHANVLHLTETF